MAIATLPEVYQLRIRLDRISPLIWRRLLALRQHFSIVHIAERLLTLVEQREERDDPRAELATLVYWLGIDRFDRRAIKRQFRQYAAEHTTVPPASAEVHA